MALCAAVLLAGGCNLASTGQNMQGKRYFDQGQYAQAIETFQNALRNNPRSADAWYNLGATCHHLGRQQRNAAWLGQSEQFLRQALAVDPNHADAWRSLAALMIENGRVAEAFQLVQGWRVRSPHLADPAIELARMYHESGNRNAAAQLLVDALNVDPTNARALKAMGRMREEAGEYQLALENYIRSYESNNMQPDVAQRIAALQGTFQASHPVPFQPGQNRLGSLNQHIPR